MHTYAGPANAEIGRSLSTANSSPEVSNEPSISTKFTHLENSLDCLGTGIAALGQALDPVSLRVGPNVTANTGSSPMPVTSPMETRLETILSQVFSLREQVETMRRQLRI